MEPGARGGSSRAIPLVHGLSLRLNIGFGLVAGRPVFLNLEQDRYLALDTSSEQDLLQALSGGEVSSLARQRLLSTGLFEPFDGAAPLLPAAVPTPGASLLDQPRIRPSLSHVVRAYWSTSRAHRRLTREPLLSVLRLPAAPLPSASADATSRLKQVSQAFLAARALAPIAPKCLPDSLALREWLSRSGHRPALVFAVRLDPFGAHCWLQHEDLVLNDAVDRVAAFTPVLVFR